MASDASTSCGGWAEVEAAVDDAEGETEDDALFAPPGAVGEVAERPVWMEIGRRNGELWDRGSKGPGRWEEEERWGGGWREEEVVVEEVVVCLLVCWCWCFCCCKSVSSMCRCVGWG